MKKIAADVIKNAGELKGVDLDLPTGAVSANISDSSGFYVPQLCNMGTGSYNRVGRKQFLHSIRISGAVFWLSKQDSGGSVTYPNRLRMALVWDKQPSGALPVYSDIFAVTTADGTTTPFFSANQNYANTGRFHVIRDKWITFNPVSGSAASATTGVVEQRQVDMFVKLNKETVYSGNTVPPSGPTISDISSGALYLIVKAGYNNAENYVDCTNLKCRVRYTD